ncbi:uncharacterized protein MELLADRAFT_58735 [Melampsora larici-populina 98AG31]|uniref:Uncharacterized protein n=1 Tax=Melampsora larici-populina (strain 98AG31 / pathotype 3-4-7) TaxID=747676 RepID=F4R4N3_MELLP|nr:uncharacterized protein MELLADRAFT_58735 [Melampsora larici-populina 98AG31]EGG12839.1 hypothetical protein MELLADRAFT_58735 [Melampsora larici-populina 98AG31]
MSDPSPNTTSTPSRPPPNTQLPQSAPNDPYGDMRQLQARWQSLSLNNTPASTPSPPKRKVYKPREAKKKRQPRDMYEEIDLVFLRSCYVLTMALMGQTDAKSPFPPPPDQFYNCSLQRFIGLNPDPEGSEAPALQTTKIRGISNHKHKLDRDYIDYIKGAMATCHIYFFTMDWGAHIDDQFNQIMIQFFVKVWKWGLNSFRFPPAAKKEAERLEMNDKILAAIYVRHYKYLRTQYKKLVLNDNALIEEQARNSLSVALLRKTEDHQRYLMAMGTLPCYVDTFENRYVNSDCEVEPDATFPQYEIEYAKVPFWQSPIATQFIDFIENHRSTTKSVTPGFKGRPKRGNKARPRRRRNPPVVDYDVKPPPGLPEDWYNPEYLALITYEDILDLEMGPRMFPPSGNFMSIFPSISDVTLYDKSGEACIPPHLLNFPLAPFMTGRTFPECPQYDFVNHPLFNMPPRSANAEQPTPGSSANAQQPTPGSSANVQRSAAMEESEFMMEHDSLFDGSDSDEEL